MTLEFHPAVQQDFNAAIDYYAAEGGGHLADRFEAELRDCLAAIKSGPRHFAFYQGSTAFRRIRLAGQPFEDRLGLVQLVLRQPRDGGADAGRTLEAPDFEGVGFGFGLGVGGKILPDALTVEPAGNAKNDIPGGIREI